MNDRNPLTRRLNRRAADPFTSEQKKLKVLVYGAGVLGSLVAARLHEAGHNISLLARGQRLADLREYGLALQNVISGKSTVAPVDVVERLAPDDVYDWVIVVMRKNQVASTLPALAANPHTPNVLFMGNNAAGPDEYTRALGRERVLLGFCGAGGVRGGPIIRYVDEAGGRRAKVTLGELNGSLTPRLQEIAGAFESAGFDVALSPDMDAWLVTHAAVVSPIALALYMAGGDNYRLARTRDAVVLGVRALREGLQVMHALNIPVTPTALQMYEWIPEPILVPLVQRLFNTQYAEIAMAGHANAARDEMKTLADEFRALAQQTTVPTPALDRLYAFVNPEMPAMAEGTAQLALDWRGVWIMLGAVAGVIALTCILARRGDE